MKRVTFRMILIAACIVMTTMAVAMAAGQIYGWVDFFRTEEGSRVPAAAQEMMKDSGGQTQTVSAVAFTVQEMYGDQNIAMVAVQAKAEEENALLCGDDPYSPIGANGENGRAAAARLNVDPALTWIDAAKQLNVPLYSVSAYLEVPAEMHGSEGYFDPMYNEDGSVSLFFVQPLNSSLNGSRIDCHMDLIVRRVDLENDENSQVQRDQMEIAIPVAAAAETHTYALTEEYVSFGMQLTKVRAELMPSGLYLYADFEALAGMSEDDFYENGQYIPVWYSADGDRYEWGLTGSYILDTSAWPVIHTAGAIAEDEIPDVLVLSLEDDNAAEGSESAPRIELKK